MVARPGIRATGTGGKPTTLGADPADPGPRLWSVRCGCAASRPSRPPPCCCVCG